MSGNTILVGGIHIDTSQNQSTKYWLHNQLHMDYHNLSRLMDNETDSIRFENIEKLCTVLECTPDELFEIIPDENHDIML